MIKAGGAIKAFYDKMIHVMEEQKSKASFSKY